MPSPVGHGLAALAIGWGVAGLASPGRARLLQGATLVGLSLAPDLDLLIGRHSAETHSLGAAVVVASLAAWWRWPIAATRTSIWLVAFLVWTSHPLLDMLGQDGRPPLGVMLFWPVSREYFSFAMPVLAAISRQWQKPGFVLHNVLAVLRELVIFVPLTAIVWAWRSRDRGRSLVR